MFIMVVWIYAPDWTYELGTNINLSEQTVEAEVPGEVDMYPHVASGDHP